MLLLQGGTAWGAASAPLALAGMGMWKLAGGQTGSVLEPLSCPSCDGPRPARPEDCLADCTFRCLLYLLAPLDCSTEAKPFYFQLARCRRRRSQQQKLSHCETELSIVNPHFILL